jgi:type IV pilus assembly protein PilV
MRKGGQRSRQHAFTLVEVLVTIVIMSVGLLGVVGLQLASMRSNHSAYLRTQATLAAYDLIDRMRADPASFNGKHFKAGADSGSSAFDNWAEEIDGLSLRPPEGKPLGEVNCAATDNACLAGNCQVVVRWDDTHGEDDALAQSGRAVDETVFSVCTRLPQ